MRNGIFFGLLLVVLLPVIGLLTPHGLPERPALGAYLVLWFLFATKNSLLSFRRWRLLKKTEVSRLGEGVKGFVELKGGLKGLDNLEVLSPLTKTKCVWFRCVVSKSRNHNSKKRDIRSFDQTSVWPVRFDDGTGSAVLFPRGAMVFPAREKNWRGKDGWKESTEKNETHWPFNQMNSWYKEELFLENDPVSVIGWLETLEVDQFVNLYVDQVFRSPWGKILRNLLFWRGTKATPINAPPGKTNTEYFREEIFKKHPWLKNEQTVRVLMPSPGDPLPFLISGKGEELLTGNYLRWSAGWVSGAVLSGYWAYRLLSPLIMR